MYSKMIEPRNEQYIRAPTIIPLTSRLLPLEYFYPMCNTCIFFPLWNLKKKKNHFLFKIAIVWFVTLGLSALSLSVIVNDICKYFETKQQQQINMNKIAETKMTLRATLYLFVADRIIVLYSETYFCS